MSGPIQWMAGARGIALFGAAAVVANCGGKSSDLESEASGGDAGLSNYGGDIAGNLSGNGGTATERGGVGGGGKPASEAGADAGGAASGGEGGTGSAGESTSGGQSGEAGSDQAGRGSGGAGGFGASGEGGAGGQSEEPACGQVRLPITFRDFNAHTEVGGHPDFAPGINSGGAMMGLVRAELDAEGKPVLVAASESAFLHGVDAFAQWYRDTPGVNAAVERELVLWKDGGGNYSNRWGANGEAWSGPATYFDIVYGGEAGMGCTGCTPSAAGACYDPCVPWGDGYLEACCAEQADTTFDGAPLFFPIDDAPNALMETRYQAKVPEEFGWVGWPWEDDVASTLGVRTPIETAWAPFPSPAHNFNFTSELEFALLYDADVTTTISVQGDDDIWVFVNGHLAVDLGSFHVPLPGSLTIAGDTVTTNAQVDVNTPPTVVSEDRTAAEFGLIDGEPYQVAIFHAERQKEGATFRLSVSGVDWRGTECVTERR